MKKKIAILGSTSSIGKALLNIIKKDKNKFEIELLTANTNYKDLINQAKQFNVKNLVITDLKSFIKSKNFYKGKKIKIFKNFDSLKIILPKKVDYVMSAISGIGGLLPTYRIIKHTKLIAIANKEAIVCGWPLIEKELKKNKTKFIPVDSEHFSIFSLLQNRNVKNIEKIYITASGGPFIDLPKSKFNKIKLSDALKHPNWSMGKKITIDSATMMNKVFEVIEAKNIFDLDYKRINILTHPKSYVHAIVKFKDGLAKILTHDPDMKIPIYNSLYFDESINYKSKPLDFNILNNLPKFPSLYETVLITINDYLVFKFLDKKISFKKLIYLINKITKLNEFQKYKKIKPKKPEDIYRLNAYVSSKMDSFSI